MDNKEEIAQINEDKNSVSYLQWVINFSQTDNLKYIRNIVECKNQFAYFNESTIVEPEQHQRLGLIMLFISLEKNSDLVFGSLKHLNTLHKFYDQKIQFKYEKHLLDNVHFNCGADLYLKNFLITINACMESSYNGARSETLIFFKYLCTHRETAEYLFAQICRFWPWTNRNKYYFLAYIFEKHNFYNLLEKEGIDAMFLIKGAFLSLQYRNLISPGHVLMTVLWRQNVQEVFTTVAETLQHGTMFECQFCINHWMKCFSDTEIVYRLLNLDNPNLLESPKFQYLHKDNGMRLILFRCCFLKEFEQHSKIKEIDQRIEILNSNVGIEHKIIIFDILLERTLNSVENFNDNIQSLEVFLKENMNLECSTLRHNIWRSLPNLFYFFASMIKCQMHLNRIGGFFNYLQNEIFDFGIQQSTIYQPVIFGIKILEILMKLIYGSKADRLIKSFDLGKSRILEEFLPNWWHLKSSTNYNYLVNLLTNDFNDVRDLACELLIRFFPDNQIIRQWKEMIECSDINQCSYQHYLARVSISQSSNSTELYTITREIINEYLTDYQDPFLNAKIGKHFLGLVNSLNEFYYSVTYPNQLKSPKMALNLCIKDDIELAQHISTILLNFLQYQNDEIGDGSPSFEKMDDSLQQLVLQSKCLSDNIYMDKKFLLGSIWMSLKACCDLASSIGVFILTNEQKTTDNEILKTNLTNCLNVSCRILLQCRHKGAIEGAGLSLGKLVNAITQTDNLDISAILLESVENLFEIIKRTDTTRRGAGFSILIHHLVKNDRGKDQNLLKYIMTVLLERANTLSLSPERINRDNVLASVLHFLCVLIKDGELKSSLAPYMNTIFQIVVGTIESKEWTVRNASLQLFGSIVPKLVGQTQFFENETIQWEPVYVSYNDIIIKTSKIHLTIFDLLSTQKQPISLSVPLVMLLEMLSRVEILSPNIDRSFGRYREIFYDFLRSNCEKIRKLAAKCFARFTEIHEIPNSSTEMIRNIANPENDDNFLHGLLMAITFLLQKYESDSRFVIENGKEQCFETASNLLRSICIPKNCSFFVRCYLLDLFLYLHFDAYDEIVLESMFGRKEFQLRDVTKLLENNVTKKSNQFGWDLWRMKIAIVYCDRKADAEIEIL